MNTTGDGCEEKFFFWLAIGMFVLVTLVIPVTAFVFDREGAGLAILLIGLAAFFSPFSSFFGVDDNKIVDILIYGCFSMGVILFLRSIILYIRDLFVKDPQSGMAEVLAIPVAAVVYGLIFFPLAEKLSKGGQQILRQVVKFLVILIVSGLVYLIYR
jgi:hypothetical protein